MKRYQHNSFNPSKSRRNDLDRERNYNRREGFVRRPTNYENSNRHDIRNRSPHTDNSHSYNHHHISHHHHGQHRRNNQEDNLPASPPPLNINEIAGSLSSASNPNQITTILASAINAAFLAGTMNSGGALNTSDRRELKRPMRQPSFSPPPSHRPHHSYHDNNEHPTRTLFIGNLDRSITEMELREIFEEFGLVEDVDIKMTNSDKSYAFVRYQNMDIAGRARRAMNNKTLGKQSIRIAYGKMIPTRCLWIGNLGHWLNYRQLLSFIERYERPDKVVWSTGTSYAHALFRSVATATEVAETIRGYVFPGTDKPLKVDFIDDSRMLKTVQNRYAGQKPREDSRYDSDPRRRDPHFRDRSRQYNTPSKLYSRNRNSPRRRRSSGDSESRHHSAVKRPHTPFSDSSENSVTNLSEISKENEHSRLSKSAKARSYHHLTKTLPEVWRGLFNLKTCFYGCKMYLISGNISLINKYIKEPDNSASPHPPSSSSGQQKGKNGGSATALSNSGEPRTPPEEGEQIDEEEESNAAHNTSLTKSGVNLRNIDLMITQRLKLEQSKLEELKAQLTGDNFCLLLATESAENKTSEPNFKSLPNLVNYLKEKDAAGIVMLDNNKSRNENGGTTTTSDALLHVFPPCPFAVGLIQKFCAPRLDKATNSETDRYLLIAIVKENS